MGFVNVDISPTEPSVRQLTGISLANIVTATVGIMLGVAGILSFLYLLWGGIQWITAGGDKDALQKARKKITQALLGLAIVFSAYALVYIVQVLFNVDLIQVNFIPI